MTPITQDDLLDAIREALSRPTDDDSGAHTMAELRASLKIGNNRLNRLLHTVQAEGRLEVVQVHRVNLAGTVSAVPAYRIKR